MEYYHQNSDLLSIIYEERSSYNTSIETPTHHHLSIDTHNNIINHDDQTLYDDVQDSPYYYYFSPGMQSSPAHQQPNRMLQPPSPESPWTCSPLQTPSPSLLYHCIASLRRHEGTIYSIAVSNGVVFTGSDSSRIRAWRQPDCAERGLLKAASGEVRAILAHGDVLFTSHRDHKVRTWNFTTASAGKDVVSGNLLCKRVSSIPRRRRSLISSFPSFFSRNKHPHQQQEQHKECISCMAYYYSEGLLYTGSHDRTVKAWRVSTRKCVDSFVAHEDKVNAILVNQDDGCVFTCSSDGSVKIWRRIYRENSHTLTMILRFQPSAVNAIALSSSTGSTGPTGLFLYSGSSDGTINFWERERMSYRLNHGGFLQGHRFAVLCLVAVAKMVFSGSEDTTIRIWRREEGSCLHECLAVLDGHRGPVRCLAACLEMDKIVMGFLVYSASLDQTFKVWRVKILPDDDRDDHHERMVVCNSSEYCYDRSGSRSTTVMAGMGIGMKMEMRINQYRRDDDGQYERSPTVSSPSWVVEMKRSTSTQR